MTATRTSPAKLGLALAALAGSLAVLWQGIASTFEPADASAHSEVVERLDEPDDATEPGAALTSLLRRDPPAPAADAARPAADASDAPAAGRPDWSALFERLMARDQALQAGPGDGAPDGPDEPEPPVAVDDPARAPQPPTTTLVGAPQVDPRSELAGLSLVGVLRGPDGRGAALLDGRSVQVGDPVPGTAWTLAAVRGEQVELRRGEAPDAPTATLWLAAPGAARSP